MLTNITLSSFKSISRAEPLELSPYSILCGSNSSGKSSLIQAILMLSQTFGSRFEQDSVVLNGHLVRLGSFRDIKNYTERSSEIKVGFKLENPPHHYGLVGLKSIEFEIGFGDASAKSKWIDAETNFHPPINKIEVRLHRVIEGVEKSESISLSTPEKNHANRVPAYASPQYYNVDLIEISEIEEIGKNFPGFEILGCEKGAIVPSILHIKYDHARKISAYVIGLISGSIPLRTTLNDDEVLQENILIPKTFFDALRRCISDELVAAIELIESNFPHLPRDVAKRLRKLMSDDVSFTMRLAQSQFPIEPSSIDEFIEDRAVIDLSQWFVFLESRPEKERKALMELIDKHRALLQEAWYEGAVADMRTVQVPLRTMHYLTSALSSYFSKSVKYLGPLRNEPQSVYSALGHMEPSQVGLKGEFTAAALHVNKSKFVQYLSPSLTASGHIQYATKHARLIDACHDWLRYMGVLTEYRTRDRGKFGYELYVKTSKDDKWQDLTHVGVGVSQVLPIVLMALLSEQDDLLIFEQPELHLHPKIQSRLCDFFIAMSMSNRQCLIETHSEYLVNRLRSRIVQSRDENILSNSSIFFVTKEAGLSKFDRIVVNRFGAIPEWPEDFFDQTDIEVQKILIDAAAKKREESKRNNDAHRRIDI
jgi:predicted ATPase